MPPLLWPTRRTAPPRRSTALDALRLLVRAHLGPALRAGGLRGSGSAWTLPCDTHWVLVGIEQDHDADERTVRLVPRLHVVGRAAWDAARTRRLLPEVPPATVPSGVGWERRLPALVPGLPDGHRWTLHREEEVAELAPRVLAPLQRHGLPALRAVLAAERAQRPACAAAACGGPACAAPADVALRAPRQRLFLCAAHAPAHRRAHGWELVGRWPDLLGLSPAGAARA